MELRESFNIWGDNHMDSNSLEVLGDGDTQSATDSQKRYWNSEPLAFEEILGFPMIS